MQTAMNRVSCVAGLMVLMAFSMPGNGAIAIQEPDGVAQPDPAEGETFQLAELRQAVARQQYQIEDLQRHIENLEEDLRAERDAAEARFQQLLSSVGAVDARLTDTEKNIVAWAQGLFDPIRSVLSIDTARQRVRLQAPNGAASLSLDGGSGMALLRARQTTVDAASATFTGSVKSVSVETDSITATSYSPGVGNLQ